MASETRKVLAQLHARGVLPPHVTKDQLAKNPSSHPDSSSSSNIRTAHIAKMEVESRKTVYASDVEDVLDGIKNAVETRAVRTWQFDYPRGVKKHFLVECKNRTITINNCIVIDYITLDKIPMLYLRFYYYESGCRDKPTLDHDVFFEFFTKLGEKLKVKQLLLQDASTKQLTGCNVSSIIFALAGRRTFYERYGFTNERFTAAIARFSMLTLQEVFNILRIHETPSEIQEYDDFKMVTVRGICVDVLDYCDSDSPHSSIANRMGRWISSKFNYIFGERLMFTKPIAGQEDMDVIQLTEEQLDDVLERFKDLILSGDNLQQPHPFKYPRGVDNTLRVVLDKDMLTINDCIVLLYVDRQLRVTIKPGCVYKLDHDILREFTDKLGEKLGATVHYAKPGGQRSRTRKRRSRRKK
jgi:hypothetical protein